MIKKILLNLGKLIFIIIDLSLLGGVIYYSYEMPESYKLIINNKLIACIITFLIYDNFIRRYYFKRNNKGEKIKND